MQVNEYYDVFISHSSIDKNIAFNLCMALEKEGLICWIAPRDVKVGLPYANSIVEGIENSKVFVVLFSSNSNTSDGVRKELEVATNSKIPIVPLRIEDIFPTKAMKFYIMSNHWIDAINSKSIDDFKDFVSVIKQSLNSNDKIFFTSPINLEEENNSKKNDISTTKLEQLFTSISSIIFPFIIIFIILVMLSNLIYPSLELSDTIYTFLVLSFIFSKIFLFFVKKVRG